MKKIFLSAAILLTTPVAWSQSNNLANVITDLYGGDGIELSVASGTFHLPHFTADSVEALENLNSLVTSTLGFSSFNSTASGFTFDLSQGVPVATEDSMGPLLSERATSLGRAELNVGFSYSNVDFDKFDGVDLDSLTIDFLHDDCCTFIPGFSMTPDGELTVFEEDFIRANINLDLSQEIFSLYANYGLTDKLDVGVVVPIVSVEARAFSFAEVISSTPSTTRHTFAGAPELAEDSTGGSESGLGDIILRAKYTFVSISDLPSMAVLAQIITPTGDEDNLLGAGETKFKGMFIASQTFGRWTPHVNLAYENSTGDDSEDNLAYAVGTDARVSQTFTVAADILGRYNPDQEIIGNHLVDIAFAVKWNPFSQMNAPFNAYIILPLNSNEGLRSDVIWGLGVDYSFN